ncbi:hypothetical protein [Desulfonatronovibrio magnus]|uniref:hypothetical protein n=1 Tax=Desulfonatronovibrio magnus TaxID=698827 RepID=UPI0012F9EB05|nr:hypothetical protein [Desulfonatronovibrio magnus]
MADEQLSQTQTKVQIDDVKDGLYRISASLNFLSDTLVQQEEYGLEEIIDAIRDRLQKQIHRLDLLPDELGILHGALDGTKS